MRLKSDVAVRRVWPISYKFKVTVNGASRTYWVIAYPIPAGGFIAEVRDVDRGSRLSYFVDKLSDVSEVVRQAIVDFNTLSGRDVKSISIEVVDVLNSYETYLSEVKEGVTNRLSSLNDVYIVDVN